MAKYVVSYTGANGVKAFTAIDNSNQLKFTFAKSEAATYEMEKEAELIANVCHNTKVIFLHDPNAATLPAGLDWQIEEVTE